MYTISDLKVQLLANEKQRVIFPEGDEPKIQNVALKLYEENLIIPWLILEDFVGLPKFWPSELPVTVMTELDKTPFIDQFLDLRGKKTSLEQAIKLMNIRTYIGTLLVKNQQAHAMVCGLTFTTADTLRPALQIIKTKPEYKIASSVMVLRKNDNVLLFSDCALNLKPTAEELATITKMAVTFARKMGIEKPEAVLLSYSTKGSGSGLEIERVQKAVELLKQEALDFVVEGEIQFDAAINPEVRSKKLPGSQITKLTPDIFIFPDLQAGNIGYKIGQYLGNFDSAGPFILGLNKPVNDLSRGASEKDIYETVLFTAYQSLSESWENNHENPCD